MNSPPECFRSLNIVFDDLVESCRTGLRKPEPEIYDLACKRLGVAPQEVSLKFALVIKMTIYVSPLQRCVLSTVSFPKSCGKNKKIIGTLCGWDLNQ